jgi:hypothetical protein
VLLLCKFPKKILLTANCVCLFSASLQECLLCKTLHIQCAFVQSFPLWQIASHSRESDGTAGYWGDHKCESTCASLLISDSVSICWFSREGRHTHTQTYIRGVFSSPLSSRQMDILSGCHSPLPLSPPSRGERERKRVLKPTSYLMDGQDFLCRASV